MDNDIDKLEIKISFLEDYINQLNLIVINQDKKIEKLSDFNKRILEKISLLEENIKEPTDNTPPPHY